MLTVELYSLSQDGSGVITWKGPDGDTHSLDVNNPAGPGEYTIENDSNGKPVMAYKVGQGGDDGELVVSLEGAPSLAATLLHNEDDFPAKYYYATDTGNSRNPLGRWSFRIKTEGRKNSPFENWANFNVMVVAT